MATTAVCTSFKQEMLQATHNFAAPLTGLAGAGTSGQFTITGLASTANIEVGMLAGGTNVAAGAVVASIDSASQVTVSKAHTGTVTSGTISFTAHTFKMALVKVSPTRSFDGTQTNVGTPGSGSPTSTNLGTDEVAASGGYSSGGTTLTNVTPTTSGTTALTDFSPDPSYTSATISTTAGIIYNNSVVQGHANGITANASGSAIGRTVSVHDFGGTQTVTAGTITFVFPTPDASNAILRVA
jgi:hypothetical protein